jgi:hypothetical protein
MFQADSVRDAAWGCDWVGTPVPFQRCLMFIIATANKQFQLTAGKFVPVSNVTMMNVCIYVCLIVCALRLSALPHHLFHGNNMIPPQLSTVEEAVTRWLV